jgi:hypothetical protein
MEATDTVEPTPKSRLPGRLRKGAKYGALLGLLGLVVGVARMVVALLGGHSGPGVQYEVFSGALVAVAYLGGFVVAGIVLGALWPLSRTRLGCYLLGYLAAAICSVAWTLMVAWDEPHTASVTPYLVAGAVTTLLFGSIAGYYVDRLT